MITVKHMALETRLRAIASSLATGLLVACTAGHPIGVQDFSRDTVPVNQSELLTLWTHFTADSIVRRKHHVFCRFRLKERADLISLKGLSPSALSGSLLESGYSVAVRTVAPAFIERIADGMVVEIRSDIFRTRPGAYRLWVPSARLNDPNLPAGLLASVVDFPEPIEGISAALAKCPPLVKSEGATLDDVSVFKDRYQHIELHAKPGDRYVLMPGSAGGRTNYFLRLVDNVGKSK